MPSHRLLLRAGYLRQLGSGIYSLLPLGKRVSDRVEQVIREEIDAIGGQEMEMPVVHPAEIWKESGRYQKIGPELVRFKDRGERDMVLAMTHEEVVAILLRDIVQSYRQLPMIVYHFQTKFRDEPRARGGLIRVREFVMKDSYSCDLDDAGLDESYRKHYAAYERIFSRLGLDAIAVGADVGIMGGTGAHEFMVVNAFGEDTLVLCDACGYADNQQIAIVGKPDPGARSRAAHGGRRDARRDNHRALANFLGIPKSKTAKAAFFVTGDGRFIVAIVRGDYDVNETKLVNTVKARRGLRPATVEEITARGMEAGYGSPIGARDAVVVVDELVARSPNLVAGANRVGWHVRNVNVPRDYTPDHVAEITNARAGRPLPQMRQPGQAAAGHRGRQHLQARDGLHGRVRVDVPGRGRRAAPDRHGLVRDRARAQRGVHRRGPSRREGHRLAGRGRAVRRAPRVDRRGPRPDGPRDRRAPARAWRRTPGARSCTTTGTSRPGVKFTDAELLGMPWILTVSPRSLAAGGVEVTAARPASARTQPLETVEGYLRDGFAIPAGGGAPTGGGSPV